ncbi:MAG: hypothetical protein M1324_04225 [Patescibacteria group bacterium]|nr:hypothetical protein [Patescibacteria group bacterium]
MGELELIQQFEKDFIEAGKMAMRLRKDATVEDKFDSGIKDIDIVTSADLAVQEFILKKLAESELKNCEMVAEENTPSKNLFAESSDLVITVDPIDGTMLYANGKKMYSVIVMLHNKKDPLYTFVYFPEVNWGVKIVEKDCNFFGEKPIFPNVNSHSKTIIHFTSVNPKTCAPDIYQEAINEGYKFVVRNQVDDGISSIGQFLLGKVDGYFACNGSAVDCLVALHYALANNYKIYRNLDISKLSQSKLSGKRDEYRGYYLVLCS